MITNRDMPSAMKLGIDNDVSQKTGGAYMLPIVVESGPRAHVANGHQIAVVLKYTRGPRRRRPVLWNKRKMNETFSPE